MPITLRALTGADLDAHLDALARLRIAVFRAFPYLYDGDEAYERRYLRTYADAHGGVLVAALDGDTVVGAATGVPLVAEPPEVREAVTAGGLDVATTFYFGESVLMPAWRGRGIGVGFFEARESHARALGGMTHAVFCAVQRPADHPRRPADYVPLDAFWCHRGYAPLPGARCTFSWRDLDETAESPKPMAFWARRLDHRQGR
ncbi:GNAT family N-acetyltransferase [Roseospira marina]|uniref:GNAT family N-acetyltransferase n=1 Tax=Roseospira marina TaxID=140057 RepID=A0A5M6IF17_9PROT|nr:GNAT family N-acetyltransferase [Roseospira marina]KAA5606537.1 GNAT family N-acetyltransferase [Roseospira marina]MBB4314034.1 GNAT superfamily N-acetyltransferase [Roseospira marina]MBB5087195.1 GNAT superfamily N-acetyltransferase [Roseospira marina]